jgi:hypothetical protein
LDYAFSYAFGFAFGFATPIAMASTQDPMLLPGGWEGILYDTMYEIKPISECCHPWVSRSLCV